MTLEEARKLTKNERRKLRNRGVDVPLLQPGPTKGYKQTDAHIKKRIKSGPNHHAWLGDEIKTQSGRSRAERRFSAKECERCGGAGLDRHHIDGDTRNNKPQNIRVLCRRCHMFEDGRLAAFKELAHANQPKAVASRWR